MKEREIKYDFLRAVAVIAIMMVHAIPAVSVNDKQWWFAAVMQPLLLSFVGIYFMLSGMFLLDSATGDIMQFYKKRVKVIVIPFLFFSVLYYLYDVSRSLEVLSWWGVSAGVSPRLSKWYSTYGRPYVVYVCDHRTLPLYAVSGPHDEGDE